MADTVDETAAPPRRDRTHWLYIAVIVAVLAGLLVGFVRPGVGKQLKPLVDRAGRVFAGDEPFDEALMVDDEDPIEAERDRERLVPA